MALVDFDYLTKKDPYNPSYISDRAVVLHLLKRNDEAASQFDTALNLDPSNPYRYSSRAYFKDRIGDFQGAIDDYTRAIVMDPEDAIAYNNRGLVEEKLGYMSRAKKSFEIADDLMGYKSKSQKNPEDVSDHNQNKLPFLMPKQENPTNKMAFTDFLNTFKKIFTEKSTWGEFIDFISSGLKAKISKNS